jgi:UDP-2,4-diacetamido-2,4,6-trideoxy-beta-L-altropyranose hydrolase
VLVRLDASSRIGIGHLARSLTLAGAFTRAGVQVRFACHALPEGPKKWLTAQDFALVNVDAEPGSPADQRQTVALARQSGANLVFIDGYQFGSDYLQGFRQARLFACYFDDMINLDYQCHAVFNQNFHSPADQFRAAPDCTLILGPQYALLRDEFVDARGARPTTVAAVGRRLLVTMGGADPTAETEKVLRALGVGPLARDGGPVLDVRVVVGSANPRASEIRAAAAASGRHQVEVLQDIRNMAEQMSWCDVALSASGTTCMELCCVGVPSIITMVVDNQRLIGPALQQLGLMRLAGWHEEVQPAELSIAIAALMDDQPARAAMVSRQRAAIDGLGKHRAVQLMLATFDRLVKAGVVDC